MSNTRRTLLAGIAYSALLALLAVSVLVGRQSPPRALALPFSR